MTYERTSMLYTNTSFDGMTPMSSVAEKSNEHQHHPDTLVSQYASLDALPMTATLSGYFGDMLPLVCVERGFVPQQNPAEGD